MLYLVILFPLNITESPSESQGVPSTEKPTEKSDDAEDGEVRDVEEMGSFPY